MDEPVVVPPASVIGQDGDALFDRLLRLLPRSARPCFLVGGAVRDCLLRFLPNLDSSVIPASTCDLDLLVPARGTQVARRLADQLGGAFYELDPVRDVGRITFGTAGRHAQHTIDVASFQGATLEDDLAGRDFTVNAMAIEITRQPLTLIDPLNGLIDLRKGQLRAVSEDAFLNDAVRTLRAVRLRSQFALTIEQHTLSLVRGAAGSLTRVSAERVRDEMVKTLSLPGTGDSLHLMDRLDLLGAVLPELMPLKGLAHLDEGVDVFEHTMEVVNRLEQLLPLDGTSPCAHLGFTDHVVQHLEVRTSGGFTRRLLLTLAGLMHDVGRPDTFDWEKSDEDSGAGHEAVGARMALDAMERLRFSREASRWVETIVRHHMRPMWLVREAALSRRAVHRFYRDVGAAGVDIVLLSLADHLAAGAREMRAVDGAIPLPTVVQLLDAYFNHWEDVVAPRPLLGGGEIVNLFKVSPGPVVGGLVRELREAQAAGEVSTRDRALEWVATRLETVSSD